ncbi:MAG TPA: pentapeptide repeat-containing protein [Kofleriaceae bacterium]|nr:pentapeptide repeat-containing protein [Kofleriaceae bacterium]
MVIAASALRAHADWLVRGSTGGAARLTLRGEDARGQDLRSAQLSGAVIDSCNFEGALLDGTTWASAIVAQSAFRDAVFADAALDDARFVDCDFRDADFSDLRRARGTTARCQFERCDLRGSIWLERSVAGAQFVDCQLDLIGGTPRDATGIEIMRPRLSGPDGAVREATAAEVLALWLSGRFPPDVSLEDKEFVRRGMRGRWRKREAYLARGPRPPVPTGVGSIADKWKEPFLPQVDEPVVAARAPAGEPVELPDGAPAAVSARRGTNGVVVYRDARSGFGVALPSPEVIAPGDQADASFAIATYALLDLRHAELARGASPADEATRIARELSGVTPEQFELGGPGVLAAAIATRGSAGLVFKHAVLAGGDGERVSMAILALSFSTELDPQTFRAIWSAILGSAWFGPDRDAIPDLIPPSAWWDPGLPLALAATRPALPRLAGLAELGLDLVGDTAILPPAQPIADAGRADVVRRLAGAGIPDAPEIAATLRTIHDLRGLAAALEVASAERAPASASPIPASQAPVQAPATPAAPAASPDGAAIEASIAAASASISALIGGSARPSEPAGSSAAPSGSSASAWDPPAPSGSPASVWGHTPSALPPPPTMPVPAPPSAPGPMLTPHSVVAIGAAESAAHGLPAVGISVDLGGTGLRERVRTQGRRYLLAAGAPGGSLGFEVWASDEPAGDHAAVQRAAAAHYRMPDLRWGQPGTLTIAGASRPAVTFMSGSGMYATHWCAALVPHAHGTLLVAASLSHLGDTPASCDRVVSFADLAQAVNTFRIVER